MLGGLVLASLLGACATPVSKDMSFGPEGGTALLVMAGPPADNAFSTEFRRVDVANGAFVDKTLEIVNAGLGGHQINGDTRSGIWLSVQEATPGDYAVVKLFELTSPNSGPTFCLNEGSPVYSLPPGKISIIRIDQVAAGMFLTRSLPAGTDDAAILKEFASVRERFPNIVGDAVVLSPSAVIRWDEKNHIKCDDDPKNMSRVR
jgi:hypothetical protein